MKLFCTRPFWYVKIEPSFFKQEETGMTKAGEREVVKAEHVGRNKCFRFLSVIS